MSLCTLPSETLCNIVSYITEPPRLHYSSNPPGSKRITRQPKNDLYALALVSRKLYAIVNPILWSDLTLNVCGYHRGTDFDDWDCVPRLNELLRANSSLVDRISTASLVWNIAEYWQDWQDAHGNEEPLRRGEFVEKFDKPLGGRAALDELLRHLSTSTSLTTLRCVHPFPANKTLSSLHEWQVGAFPNLARLELRNDAVPPEGQMSADIFAHLARLPRLEELDYIGKLGPAIRSSAGPPVENLKTLRVSQTEAISFDGLRWLFPQLSKLDHLTLGPPETAHGIDPQWEPPGKTSRIVHLRDPLQPSRYLDLLLSLSATIRSLHLTTRALGWKDHDGTMMDFTPFSTLSDLSISSDCLFGNHGAAGDCSSQLSTRLPISLQNLHVFFYRNQGLFWPMDVNSFYSQTAVQGWSDGESYTVWKGEVTEECVAWIWNLLQGPFQSLKNVTLVEVPPRAQRTKWKVVSWLGPTPLQVAAESTGVVLRARLRVPLRCVVDYESGIVEKVGK